MAEDGDGLLNKISPDLSLTQKLQLGAFGTGTLVFLTGYFISALLNGFHYVNQWIMDNPVPVVAFWGLTIGMLPVYRNIDPTELKYLKQAAYNFVTMGGFSVPVWIFYQFNPPTTGIDRIVAKISKYIFIYVVFSTALSYSYFRIKTKDD